MSKDVAVLGVGMHPWGQVGGAVVREIRRCGRSRRARRFGCELAGCRLHRRRRDRPQRVRRIRRRSHLRQALGWNALASPRRTPRVRRSQALDTARARILAGLSEVALVVGADTTPKGFLAPVAGERWDDPDWLRFRLMGMTNPAYFALNARRRIDLYGATAEDFANVKVKNAKHGLNNPNARYRKEVTVENVLASPPVVSNPPSPARHLRDVRRRRRNLADVDGIRPQDGHRGTCSHQGYFDGHADVPPQTIMDMPNFSTDSSSAVPAPERTFKESIGYAAYEEAGISPEDVDVAEVYDLATSVELDWIEDLALCKRGEAEHLLRAGDTSIGGRIPVNPSGGLACFGEAVPAQALAQVCELTWQLRGQAEGRQVEGAASVSPPTKVCSDTAPR